MSASATEHAVPRLCCLECMTRDVTVHQVENESAMDSVLVWVECRCGHALMLFDGGFLHSLRDKPERAVPLDYCINITDQALGMFERAEARMLALQERVQWLDRFIKQRPR